MSNDPSSKTLLTGGAKRPVSKNVTHGERQMTRQQKRYSRGVPNDPSAKTLLTRAPNDPSAKMLLTGGTKWPVSKNVTHGGRQMTLQQKCYSRGRQMSRHQKCYSRGVQNDPSSKTLLTRGPIWLFRCLDAHCEIQNFTKIRITLPGQPSTTLRSMGVLGWKEANWWRCLPHLGVHQPLPLPAGESGRGRWCAERAATLPGWLQVSTNQWCAECHAQR